MLQGTVRPMRQVFDRTRSNSLTKRPLSGHHRGEGLSSKGRKFGRYTCCSVPSQSCKAVVPYKPPATHAVIQLKHCTVTTRQNMVKQIKGLYGASFIPEWLARAYQNSKKQYPLGRQGHQQFFFKAEDALSIEGKMSIELPIVTGMAPAFVQAQDMEDVYLLLFPLNPLTYARPQTEHAVINGQAHPHFFADIGKTAVKIGSDAQQTREIHSDTEHGCMLGMDEFVTEGGRPVPTDSFLLKISIDRKTGTMSDDVAMLCHWDNQGAERPPESKTVTQRQATACL